MNELIRVIINLEKLKAEELSTLKICKISLLYDVGHLFVFGNWYSL